VGDPPDCLIVAQVNARAWSRSIWAGCTCSRSRPTAMR